MEILRYVKQTIVSKPADILYCCET